MSAWVVAGLVTLILAVIVVGIILEVSDNTPPRERHRPRHHD